MINNGGHMFLLENAVSVRLPADLKELPDHLFSDCYKLKDVEIPKGVTVIGGSAFSDCNELDQI
ncbi:MAG: leucine-rich repeat protein, partial [Clostridia bacterium]|nr:leucine-rich repeat protein [Clostridia bacterium]